MLLLLLAVLVGQGAVGQEEGSGLGPEPPAGVSSTQDPRDLFLQSINENVESVQAGWTIFLILDPSFNY